MGEEGGEGATRRGREGRRDADAVEDSTGLRREKGTQAGEDSIPLDRSEIHKRRHLLSTVSPMTVNLLKTRVLQHVSAI